MTVDDGLGLGVYTAERSIIDAFRLRHQEGEVRRATRDIDLLPLRTDNEPREVERFIVEVASVPG
jgi:hypothetical protein